MAVLILKKWGAASSGLKVGVVGSEVNLVKTLRITGYVRNSSDILEKLSSCATLKDICLQAALRLAKNMHSLTKNGREQQVPIKATQLLSGQ